eukprot:9641443-Alexandrium_andersonii.AAC.1
MVLLSAQLTRRETTNDPQNRTETSRLQMFTHRQACTGLHAETCTSTGGAAIMGDASERNIIHVPPRRARSR